MRGDDTRDWGLATGPGTTTYFDAVNRNKRSIGLDLAKESGVALAPRASARPATC